MVGQVEEDDDDLKVLERARREEAGESVDSIVDDGRREKNAVETGEGLKSGGSCGGVFGCWDSSI